jgi:hypothetical protein
LISAAADNLVHTIAPKAECDGLTLLYSTLQQPEALKRVLQRSEGQRPVPNTLYYRSDTCKEKAHEIRDSSEREVRSIETVHAAQSLGS